jgi:hypothetical protein
MLMKMCIGQGARNGKYHCSEPRSAYSGPVGHHGSLTMRRFLTAALVSSAPYLFAEAPAVQAAECYPHCDYNHYYGPADFTYVRPGLYGYPVCGPRGECSPHLVYSPTGVRRWSVTIRFPRLMPRRAAQ